MNRVMLVGTLVATLCMLAPTVSAQRSTASLFRFPAVSGALNTGMDDTDPLNDANDVVSVDTDPGTFAGGDSAIGVIKRRVHSPVHRLDNRLEVKYLFVDRTCVGGAPRIELAVDTDGNGSSNGNAFGYLGDQPFGGDCPEGVWTYEDMTNDVAKWDLSQFGGGMTNTWGQVEAFFAVFPNHHVRNASLVDDSASFAPTAEGCAYYDLLSIGRETLEDRRDTKGKTGGGPNDC